MAHLSILGVEHIIKTHDGSMVLLYMVSHQYTPVMLALIYQHHGSVMGNQDFWDFDGFLGFLRILGILES